VGPNGYKRRDETDRDNVHQQSPQSRINSLLHFGEKIPPSSRTDIILNPGPIHRVRSLVPTPSILHLSTTHRDIRISSMTKKTSRQIHNTTKAEYDHCYSGNGYFVFNERQRVRPTMGWAMSKMRYCVVADKRFRPKIWQRGGHISSQCVNEVQRCRLFKASSVLG
jgi:hypothetical protein